MRAFGIFPAVCFASLMLGSTARADVIVTYTVEPWANPLVPDCTTSTPASASLICATGSVGAYSNTITLAPGVPQTAILFPVIFTEPADGAVSVQSGPLLPTVDLSYTNTVTGQTGSLSGPLAAEYLTGSVTSIYEQVGPDVYTAPGLALRIDPMSTLGPVVAGSVVTDNATGTFQDPLPLPEPAGWIMMLAAGFYLCLAKGIFGSSIRPNRGASTRRPG